MSIIFLEPFIFDNNSKDNIFIFQSVNLIIYLNMASIICFIIYSLHAKTSEFFNNMENVW